MGTICFDISEEIRDLLKKEDDERTDFLEKLKTEADGGSETQQLLLGEYYLAVANTRAAAPDRHDGDVAGEWETAVTWLERASRQGNARATELLQLCWENNTGVTPRNLDAVRWCVMTPALEKQARLAARSLYRRLSPLAGGDKARYTEAVRALTGDKAQRRLLEKTGSTAACEEDFVERVVRKLTVGSSSGLTGGLLDTEVDEDAYSSAPWTRKLLQYPGKTVSVAVDAAVAAAGRQGVVWLRSLVPTHQLSLLAVVALYSHLSARLLLWFLPLAALAASVAAMVITTMQMVYARRKQTQVRGLANLLSEFNSAVDSDSAESAFSLRSLAPYGGFFAALGGAVLTFALADKAWVPAAELTVLSLFFTLTCFLALGDKHDHLVVLAILCNVVSSLPVVLLERVPYVPGLYHLLALVAGSVYSVELAPGLALHLGLPSLAYCVVPVLFLKMAVRGGWTGTYRVLVPHLVCFFWWQCAVMFSRQATWLGLARASLGWAGLVLLLPLITVLVALYLFFFVFKLFTLGNVLRFVTTLVLLAVPIALGMWAKNGFKVRGFSVVDSRTRKARALLVFAFCVSLVPAVYFVTPPAATARRDVAPDNHLTWPQYHQYCSEPQWQQTSIADAMIRCGALENAMVHWTEGRVSKVVLKQADNPAAALLSGLPLSLANWLKCTYGDELPADCGTLADPADTAVCELRQRQNMRCHLDRLSRLTFEVWVTMDTEPGFSPQDVRLEASDWFRDVLLQLRTGDRISFRAMLKDNIGNRWPQLKLYHVEVPGRALSSGSLTLLPAETWSVVEKLKLAAFHTWNFFIAPVIVIETEREADDN